MRMGTRKDCREQGAGGGALQLQVGAEVRSHLTDGVDRRPLDARVRVAEVREHEPWKTRGHARAKAEPALGALVLYEFR